MKLAVKRKLVFQRFAVTNMLKQYTCGEFLNFKDSCCPKDERIVIVLYLPDEYEWAVLYSCCKHLHEIKELERKNMEIYRSRNPVVRISAPKKSTPSEREDFIDLLLDI